MSRHAFNVDRWRRIKRSNNNQIPCTHQFIIIHRMYHSAHTHIWSHLAMPTAWLYHHYHTIKLETISLADKIQCAAYSTTWKEHHPTGNFQHTQISSIIFAWKMFLKSHFSISMFKYIHMNERDTVRALTMTTCWVWVIRLLCFPLLLISFSSRNERKTPTLHPTHVKMPSISIFLFVDASFFPLLTLWIEKPTSYILMIWQKFTMCGDVAIKPFLNTFKSTTWLIEKHFMSLTWV